MLEAVKSDFLESMGSARLAALKKSASPRLRPWLKAAVVGAGVALIFHLVSLGIFLVPQLQELAPRIRSELASSLQHLAWVQLQIAVGIGLVGAGAGVLARLALLGLGTPASSLRIAAGAVALIGAQVARVVAHRPALFEDLLWRNGGWRAKLQVLIAERVGATAIDAALASIGVLWVVISLWNQRQRWRLTQVAIGGGLIALLIAAALISPPRHYRGRGRPVIILAGDSVRPDHFSSEGYYRPTTPNIDQLRKQGLWITDVFSPIASTTAAWASMLSGVYPHRHGIRDLFPRAEVTNVLLPTLPKILKSQGYETAVVSDYAGESFSRIHLGFDRVDAPPATSLEVFADREALQRLPLALAFLSGAWGERFFPVARYLPVNADPAELTERLEAQLDRLLDTGRPFLLVAFYSVTHLPFAVPMPDAKAFTSPGYSGPSRYGYEIQQVKDISRLSHRPSDEEIEQVRALYDGSLKALDREVGKFVRHLDEVGVTDRLLIITSDHGESLFEPGATTEHGKWFVGGVAANRIPMLLQGTGIQPETRDELASGLDLMPTVLDALSLPLPDGLDGVSLLRPADPNRTVFAESALWLGGEATAPPGSLSYPPLVDILEVEPVSHALVLRRSYVDTTVTAKLRVARKGPWELVYMPTRQAPVWQLFNLKSDRYAERDVKEENPEIFEGLQRDLKLWLTSDPLRWLDAGDRLVFRVEQ